MSYVSQYESTDVAPATIDLTMSFILAGVSLATFIAVVLVLVWAMRAWRGR